MNRDLEPAEPDLFPGHAPPGLCDNCVVWVNALLEHEGTAHSLTDVPPIRPNRRRPPIRRHSSCSEPDEQIPQEGDRRTSDGCDRGNNAGTVALRICRPQAHNPGIRSARLRAHVGTQLTADPGNVILLPSDSERVNRRIEKEVAALAATP